ncbi:benzoate membrane transport protein [Moraxella cuniculi DSM 21768]|uniref:Benzoate membrane transport protein n=1 Tax=Moraxella cuniculi DSM 21768 TaxID=1122245 RepID=A0A1N7FIE5_9GAMM|nr:benzoate/H(+) symporter BenE family transporter [Moraxella cuniculi]OOS02262.1 benzoate transporter [Moraxella cuniculi]SIS00015.1 benzoate membrane transport protein [Moraxella cuniculi DSM 21768]
MSWIEGLLKDWSLSATIAGFLAVAISYAGPLVIVFQAGQQAGLDNDMMISWIWAISIGSALASIALSLYYRIPVLLAWSIPGTVLLLDLLPQMTLSEMVGAYILTSVISLVIGASGYFDKLLSWIPQGVAAGMMVGILLNFGLQIFNSASSSPTLVFTMLIVYLIGRSVSPRYVIFWVLLSGLVAAYCLEGFGDTEIGFSIAKPQVIAPDISWQAILNLAVPLVILNFTGQFLPGMALLRLNDYQMSSKPVINTASLTSLVIAPFGGISIVQAAVTATLCMGKECHEQSSQRYIGGVANGLFYLLGALFAGSLVGLFEILPSALIGALAGLALLGALLNNLSIAMQVSAQKEAALITFLTTASDISLLGLSSVFWGVVIGMISYFILNGRIFKKDIA